MDSSASNRAVARRYVLAGPLGHGNMGTVYRATDRLTGQEVALKQVKGVLRLMNGDLDENVHLALAKEFTVLSTLRHPNIITVVDYGFAESGYPYVVMELLHNARPITDAGRGLSLPQKTDLLLQLLQALVYLHRRGVLHCDLKPRNVLVTDEVDGDGLTFQRVKVLDFGLSSLRDQPQEATLAGTPGYMAPELWQGAAASKASDLYAFGVICYELYAGRRPFESNHLPSLYQMVREQPPDLDALDVPEHIRYMIGWLLAKEPQNRYTDASEVLNIMRTGVDFMLTAESQATRESFLQAARFVGRDNDMALLMAQLRRAVRGQGSAWLVGGESGVGKSRLLDELRTQALVHGAAVVRGQAQREGGAPYAIWHDIMRWLCLTTPLDDDEAAVLHAAFPDIEPLLGRNIRSAPELPPKAEHLRLLLTVESALRRLHTPLVILLEDLHWDLGESHDLLQHLSGIAPQLPVLIVASYRDDERPDLPASLPDMQLLRLARLTPADTADLLEAMLGPAGRLPSLVEMLQAETEGNVFFLVETVRALAEEAGQLESIGSTPLPTHILTGGMNGIIRRRLDRVPVRARYFLQAAAVAGRELDLAVLAEVLRATGTDDTLDDLLGLCADAAVLTFANNGWHFAHAKLRDGVQHALTADHARRLHERVAEAIETVYQYRLQETAGALSYHWHQAGSLAKEQHYATLAGEQAARHAAHQTAVGFFERAVALLDDVQKPLRQQASLLAQLGDALRALGSYEQAKARYEASLALAQAAGYGWGVAAGLNSLGQLALEQDQRQRAEDYLEQALAKASAVRAMPIMLAALSGLAALLCESGHTVMAVEYAALVHANPAADGSAHYACERLLQRLQRLIPSDDYSAAYERGQWLSLRTVIEQILDS